MRKRATFAISKNPPPWMTIFVDLVTLLLTFFIILVSLSAFDDKNIQQAITSVYGVFGNATGETPGLVPFDNTLYGGKEDHGTQKILQEIKQALKDDGTDVRLRQNKQLVEFSFGNDVLFAPASAELSAKGRGALRRLLPYMQEMEFPLVISGHSATQAVEQDSHLLTPDFGQRFAAAGWELSMQRAQTVYLFFKDSGIHPAMLSMEGHGEYKPVFYQATSLGKRSNSRVDLVFDKRNKGLARILDRARRDGTPANKFHYEGFVFDLDYAPEGGAR